MIKWFLNSSLILIFFLIIFPDYSFGYGSHSLRGISGVAVFIENLSNHLTDREIYLPELKKTLYEKIDASDVNAYKESEWMNRAGGGYIKIRIISSEISDIDSFVIYLNFEFYRPVTLMANILGESKLSTAATWSTGKLMSCEKNEVYKCIFRGASELTDIFIKEYLEVNEIQSTENKKKKR